MKVEYEENTSTGQIIIRSDIIEKAVTLLHLTDSHLLEVDDREEELELLHDICRKWKEIENVEQASSSLYFHNILKLGNENEVDCTVMTGDVVDFPSLANLEFVKQSLQSISSPYLYTLGNHDWHYPYLEWNDTTRREYYPKFYDFTGSSPAFQSINVNGIKLIAIDNSNYQISEEQLERFREQLSDGLPCLLFMHIPLYLASLETKVVQKWKAPIMMAASGWDRETQQQWKLRDADPSTKEFYHLVTGKEHDQILGIFCGHVHFSHKDEFRPNRFQFITPPCFVGGYRVIKILPWQQPI